MGTTLVIIYLGSLLSCAAGFGILALIKKGYDPHD